ncbi:MAG TPA: methyl-accepting chemotaxis protein [Xanthobacteraceae bacterium]|nr:methyl-accepting chemotaxis protein [Xanthobacteraceae bacterium]
MAFLDNIKISVKIIGCVLLLAIVSIGLAIFSGQSLHRMDNAYSALLEGDAQARVELARITRRAYEISYNAVTATSYPPDSADAKKYASEVEVAYKAGLENFQNAKKYSPRRQKDIEKQERDLTGLRDLAAGIANGYIQTQKTNAAELRKLNQMMPALAKDFRSLNESFSTEMSSSMRNLSDAGDRALILIYACSAIGILLSMLLALWISMAKIAKPLNQLGQRMGALANGDLAVEIDGQARRDEVGTMAKAVQVFKDNAVALKESEAQAETSRRAAEEERVRNEASRAEAARQVQRVVTGLGAGLERMATGDLTYRITDEFVDEYKKVQEDFNAAITQLQETIKNIAASTKEVSNAASEISVSTSDLSQRTEEQAASLEETSASMEQMSVTVKKNAESAAQANQFANETALVADRGGAVVSEAIGAMARIEDSSRKISDIISVIDEIARQTNLLALNAAVEAARAGEAGRGFAVVASEVRSLAQRSSQAAKDIKDLITNSSTQVQEGVELVNKAGASLTEIVESIKKVAQIVADIAVASNEQATGIDQINTALNQMDEVTQQNSALVEENAATAKTLEQQSGAMNESVGTFKLSGTESGKQAVVALKPATAAAAPAKRAVARRGTTRSQGALALATQNDAEWKEF